MRSLRREGDTLAQLRAREGARSPVVLAAMVPLTGTRATADALGGWVGR